MNCLGLNYESRSSRITKHKFRCPCNARFRGKSAEYIEYNVQAYIVLIAIRYLLKQNNVIRLLFWVKLLYIFVTLLAF